MNVQSIISVLDADLAIDEQAEYRDLAISQIKIADLVIINKTDLVTPARLSVLKQQVKAIVPRACIWETSFGDVPLELNLWPIDKRRSYKRCTEPTSARACSPS